MPDPPPLLQMRAVRKSFPGVRALDGVDFFARRGEIHALMGENGAGKSTLIKVLTGVYRRDGGEALLDGVSVDPRTPAEAQALGISTVYQEVNLVPTLSVAENLFMGRQPRLFGRKSGIAVGVLICFVYCLIVVPAAFFIVRALALPLGRALRWLVLPEVVAVAVAVILASVSGLFSAVTDIRVPLNWRRINQSAKAAVTKVGLDIDVTRPLRSYSIAIQQMVAIARALDVSAKLLILDEPTSSLDAGEVARLFDVMRRLRDQGLGIVFVTHFLEQVYQVTDRITVLRNGRLVGEYETKQLPRAELIAKMMGRELAEFETSGHDSNAPATATEKRTLVRLKGFGKRGAIQPFDLEIREGEVVGLAGLLGSGRTEIARLLFGVDHADQGTALVNDQPTSLSSPRSAIACGFAFLPEDRKTEGIVPDLSVRENIILALQASKGWLAALPRRKQEELADHYIKALGISTPHAEQSIRNLSGGNQQKALIARWLASNPRLLILDEPTRGIDVGAKAEIQKLILDLCARGMAVLFISSELEETVRCSDRVAVLRDREKIAELSGGQISEQAILHTIAGAKG